MFFCCIYYSRLARDITAREKIVKAKDEQFDFDILIIGHLP